MDRIQKVRKKMLKLKCEAVLISNPVNVFYLSGFKGSNGKILVKKNGIFLITDFRYLRSAKKQIPSSIKIYDQKNGFKKILRGVHQLGFESSHLTFSQYQAFKKAIKPVKFKPVLNLVEELRMLKDESEVRIIKKAVKHANSAYLEFVETIKVGQSELDMEENLLSLIKKRGSDEFSFSPIISFGSDTADVHHLRSSKKLKKGQMILVDFGLKYKDYCTDMTRMIYTKMPSKKQKEIYETVLRANKNAIDSIQLNKRCSDIDHAARMVIENAGYGDFFGHSTGHGVGLEVHEMPNVSSHSKSVIKSGMLITIEPGIYTFKYGGVRIEDMVYINTNGGVEVLTKGISKELKFISL